MAKVLWSVLVSVLWMLLAFLPVHGYLKQGGNNKTSHLYPLLNTTAPAYGTGLSFATVSLANLSTIQLTVPAWSTTSNGSVTVYTTSLSNVSGTYNFPTPRPATS